MRPPPPWTIVYADGSANVYRFQADGVIVRFTYEPVTPERSSTGFYSGGNPIDQPLTNDDPRLDELWQHVHALDADTASHAEERNKGDGAFTITVGEKRRRFLVLRSATRKLEAFLVRDLRGVDG